MYRPADARRRQTPCSNSRPSNSSNRSCVKSIVVGYPSLHFHPQANPTSSHRWPIRYADAERGRHAHACAAEILPAKQPTAWCHRSVQLRFPRRPSKTWSSHCCARGWHRRACCPQSASHREMRRGPAPRYRSPPARPPNNFQAKTGKHSAAAQTHCVAVPRIPRRSASELRAMAWTDRRSTHLVRSLASRGPPRALGEFLPAASRRLICLKLQVQI